jgi:hypothetical protein
MSKLYLSYGPSATDRVHLDGSDIVPPVKGAHYSPGSGQRSWDDQARMIITEEIKVDLSGSYRAITDWINFLSALVVSDKLGARHQVNRFTLNYIEPDELSAYSWNSKLLDIAITLDAHGLAQRSLGHQLVNLRITRLDEWEHVGSDPDMFFPNGANYNNQGFLINHNDSGALHKNTVYIPAACVKGDRPSRTYLKIGNNSQVSHDLGTLYIGCAWPDLATDAPIYLSTFEGEDLIAGAGVSKVTVSNASCSGGYYANFMWTPTGETRLCSSPLAGSKGKMWHGRPIKPLLCLQSSMAYTDLWIRLKVQVPASNAVVYETEWINYIAGIHPIEFPTLFCPPEGLIEGNPLDLVIYVMKASAGAYTLPLDFLYLWPIDGGFRRLVQSTYMTGPQFVVDDGLTDQVFAIDSSFNYIPSVSDQGQRIGLLPNRVNVLALANISRGLYWMIDDQLTLEVSFNIVKWNL